MKDLPEGVAGASKDQVVVQLMSHMVFFCFSHDYSRSNVWMLRLTFAIIVSLPIPALLRLEENGRHRKMGIGMRTVSCNLAY